MLPKTLRKLKRRLFPSDFDRELVKWFSADGDGTKRLDYDLNENSLVIDLGGYKGQFASDLFSKYLCKVMVFEPIAEFFESMQQRFAKNPKIQPFMVALGEKDKEEFFYLDNDGTSINNKSNKSESFKRKVIFRDIEAFFKENAIESVDLIKINIEGGEYDLLEYLLEKNMITKFKNIQVQFHKYIPNSEAMMTAIQTKLAATHHLKWQYRFVWENWTLND